MQIAGAERRPYSGTGNPFFGKHHSEETKAKIGEASRRRRHSEESKAKISASLKGRKRPREFVERTAEALRGKPLSLETKAKISEALKGRTLSQEARDRISLGHKGRPSHRKGKCLTEETKAKLSLVMKEKMGSPDMRLRLSEAHKGKHFCEEVKAKLRRAMLRRWQDPESQQALLKGWRKRPNKDESRLQDILDRNFPGEWKYVGDGQIIIGGKVPDFINVNGKKQLIELFGRPWHDESEEIERKGHFKQYGFQTAVVWSKQVRGSERDLIKELVTQLDGSLK